MKQILKLIANSLLFRKSITNLARRYFMKKALIKILDEADSNFRIHQEYPLKDIFKNQACTALFNSIFVANQKTLTVQDLSLSILLDSMAILDESNKEQILDASVHIVSEIKNLITQDKNWQLLFQLVDKNETHINLEFNKEELLTILNDKKEVFRNYFTRFNDSKFSNYIQIFHSEYGESWVYFDEKNSIKVFVDLAKIPEGLILPFFNYKSSRDGRLTVAYEYKDKTYYNQRIEGGKLVWLN